MLRATGAVVAGYAVMFLCVFLTFSGLYLTLGPDGAFKPGTYDVSVLWLVVSTVLSIFAALAGGFVCAMLSRGGKAPWALALFVLILGLLMAIPEVNAPRSHEARTGDVPNLEAMTKAKSPVWVALLNPLIGAAGALAGAGLRRSEA
jgi:hypothetical protein